MSHIQRQSRRVRIVLQLFLVLLPVTVCYFWLTVNTPRDYLTTLGIVQLSFDITHFTHLPLSTAVRVQAAIASLLLSGVVMYALSVLIRVFRNYENGEIFSLENAKSYQKLGYCVFYWVLGSVVYRTVVGLILSFNNPPGQRIVAVSFVGVDMLTLLFGLIVFIIAWVMKEGHIIADENSHTV